MAMVRGEGHGVGVEGAGAAKRHCVKHRAVTPHAPRQAQAHVAS